MARLLLYRKTGAVDTIRAVSQTIGVMHVLRALERKTGFKQCLLA